MKQKRIAQFAFFSSRALLALLVCAAGAGSFESGTLLAFFRLEAPERHSQRTLAFAERIACQRAIEEVYWRHRIWPKEQCGELRVRSGDPNRECVADSVQAFGENFGVNAHADAKVIGHFKKAAWNR
jgi:hypothetical protein